MKLFENHEPTRPFPCPRCAEYLSAEAPRCRFCGAEIDPDFARDASRREALANRLYRRSHYAKHLRRGGGLFALGAAAVVASYFLFRELLHTDFVWIPRGLILGGGADFLYGVYGLISEARGVKGGML